MDKIHFFQEGKILSKTKVTLIGVSIGAVGLIAAALIVVFGLNASRGGQSNYAPDPTQPPQSQEYQATQPPTDYYTAAPVYDTEPPTAPPAVQTEPVYTAPPETAAPVISNAGWAVEVWKEGNPPPIGVAFFTDLAKAEAWAKNPTGGWQRGSGAIPYNGDKAAYIKQFGESDPSTAVPVEVRP
jgi:hypothetical protein